MRRAQNMTPARARAGTAAFGRRRAPIVRAAAGAALWLLLAMAAAGALAPDAARAQIVPGASSHDTSQPIEITADSLEVEQERQIATFTGNVDAVQGDMILKADKLIVHYKKNSKNGQNNVSRIVAEGNVFLASPDSTAQGDHGVYDVDGDSMVLTGNVVLTRDDNVIRGDRLVLDLATGKSRMESATETAGTSAAPAKGGRVKALFVPKSKKAKKKND